jgi:hypothetical protein
MAKREKTCTFFKVHPGAIYTFRVLILLYKLRNPLISLRKLKYFKLNLRVI